MAPPVRLSFCRQKLSITASFGINNINVIYTLTSLYGKFFVAYKNLSMAASLGISRINSTYTLVSLHGRTTFSPNLGKYKKQAFRA